MVFLFFYVWFAFSFFPPVAFLNVLPLSLSLSLVSDSTGIKDASAARSAK